MATNTTSDSSSAPAPTRAARKPYVPAVTPGLRKLLYVVLGLLALLGANSAYLLSVTALETFTGHVYQNYFSLLMFLAHVVLGLLLIVPFVVFGALHIRNSWRRKNRRAVRVGYALFAVSLLVLITGVLLMRVLNFDLRHPTARAAIYWLHVLAPLAAAWLYWLHRLAGPPIQWRVGLAYGGVVGGAVLAMIMLHSQDPRQWNVAGPTEGEVYFQPSLARTSTGNFIPARTLMMDNYCQKCHPDVHANWSQSVHRFSSFNNPAYLASVKETREVALKRDGSVKASRWCAGCHDPVPFYSGAFDDPKFDVLQHPTAHAGITCTVCHAITHVNSTEGNAAYTIEEPEHYPFAASNNPLLQWVNNQLVKAKPDLHKKTFLKDFHRTAEFCSTCHKVSLPKELNHYKEFLRGQNHYDPYLLSGVSGHGARSFYYPPEAKTNCAQCHMPLAASSDFGAKPFDDSGKLTVHNHLFPAANSGIAWLRNEPDVITAHQEFLKDVMRVDLFGVRDGGAIDGELHAPLRPEVPALAPGKQYLLEAVIRTMKMGHLFTQGTVDSNEIWVDITVTSGERVIGRSGGIDTEKGNEVDRWAHYVNVFLLDREGNRINRRNPQDIFTPLYNHQIPPGAAASLHYGLRVPDDVTAPITVELKLQYRKFDTEYMQFVAKNGKVKGEPIRGDTGQGPYVNELPITTLAVDRITFPVEGIAAEVANAERDIPAWQRWNDYGIGLLLKGKAELRQAEEAFQHVEELKQYHGPLNLARVYFTEGRLDEAAEALQRAAEYTDPPAPPWTLAWLSGLVSQQQPGGLEAAERNFRKVLEERTPAMIERKFDFSLDYEVRNQLGTVLFDLARQQRGEANRAERERLLKEAIAQFETTLKTDSENVAAHYNLHQLYEELSDKEKAAEHLRQHARLKPDDNATDRAVRLAREKYPAGNHAAEAVVIYPLQRPQAPELPAAEAREGEFYLSTPIPASP
ncbi:MAG TPA: multiheme c-type cytochrome [Pirellulaceae bacterium]|nr:multiheme c-type cytochrome [Pirellulaceae bacterium]